MPQTSRDLRTRITTLESELSACRYVRRDLEEKLGVTKQKLRVADQHIKTLELCETSLRTQVELLNQTAQSLRQQLEEAKTRIEGTRREGPDRTDVETP